MTDDEVRRGLDAALVALSEAPVTSEPFLFAPLTRAFGPDLFRHILANMPADDFYDWGMYRSGQEGARGIQTLNPAHLKRLPAAQRTLWTQIARWMESDRFASTLLGKFDREVAQRFSRRDQARQLFAEVKLVRDKANYALQPHTDQSDRVATVMFYLPPDESIVQHGTSIYRPRIPGKTCDGSARHEFVDFELVDTAPFAPDSGLAFCRSDRSFHGVKPVGSAPIQRDFLTFSIRERRRELVADAKRLVRSLQGNAQMVRVHTQYA